MKILILVLFIVAAGFYVANPFFNIAWLVFNRTATMCFIGFVIGYLLGKFSK